MVNIFLKIFESALVLLRRVIDEESESLDKFYAQYE